MATVREMLTRFRFAEATSRECRDEERRKGALKQMWYMEASRHTRLRGDDDVKKCNIINSNIKQSQNGKDDAHLSVPSIELGRYGAQFTCSSRLSKKSLTASSESPSTRGEGCRVPGPIYPLDGTESKSQITFDCEIIPQQHIDIPVSSFVRKQSVQKDEEPVAESGGSTRNSHISGQGRGCMGEPALEDKVVQVQGNVREARDHSSPEQM